MEIVKLTCIECPVGCAIEVKVDGGQAISVEGNGCPRGKMYAQNEVLCPKRVVTSTVRAENGKMIPVKTNIPVKKTDIFEVMKKINSFTCKTPVKIGDVLIKNVSEDADIVACMNVE